uniref:Uncharacterized protein n=1 Tax=Magallana gigas TaxID=29159 RepID=K1P786_MAGGI
MLLAEDWRKCVQDCQESELILPLYKIKIYEEGKLCPIFKNEVHRMREHDGIKAAENRRGLKRARENPIDDSDSTVSMVAALLPSDDPTVKEFLKYRRILKSTNDQLLRNFYDAALAKLQTAIIRRHRELMEKKDEKSHPLIKIAEKLLVHWNIYHF